MAAKAVRSNSTPAAGVDSGAGTTNVTTTRAIGAKGGGAVGGIVGQQAAGKWLAANSMGILKCLQFAGAYAGERNNYIEVDRVAAYTSEIRRLVGTEGLSESLTRAMAATAAAGDTSP